MAWFARERAPELESDVGTTRTRSSSDSTSRAAFHDISSLGAVLREIGLWRSAIGFESNYAEIEPEAVMNSLMEHAQGQATALHGVEYTDAALACINGALLSSSTQGAGQSKLSGE